MESELLNQQIEKYVIINAKDIQKIDGTEIGRIESKGWFSIKTSLFDNNDSVVLTIQKLGRTGNKYEIKDAVGNTIGIVKYDGVTTGPDVFMKNPQGKKILTLQWSMNLSSRLSNDAKFEIKTINDKNVAKYGYEIKNLRTKTWAVDKWTVTHILQITDLDFDRKTLLGFFISTLSGTRSTGVGGGVVGI